MKLAGTYGGRLRLTVWRRKSTILGATMAAALVLLCLQYNAAKEAVKAPPPPPPPLEGSEAEAIRRDRVQFMANLPVTASETIDSAGDGYMSSNVIYPGLDPKSIYIPPQRLVHLDLKGAPPKVCLNHLNI